MSIAKAVERLRTRFEARASTGASILDLHSKGEAHHAGVQPDAVLFPETTEEVAEIIRICAEEHCPITPYAVGSSVEAQVTPVRGGVSVDMMRMNKVLAIHEQDLDAVVQPGVTRSELNAALRHTGLFFPVDPGADASLGGMAATRASGTNAVRYGTMKDAVLRLEAVVADGSIIRTGGRARKSAAGYDLTRLLIGSEGTLGIITELTVRLHGLPEAISAATCGFPDVEAAVQTVIQTIQMDLPVARIEFLDEAQMAACIAYSDLDLEPAPTLFLEFHGSQASVAEQAETFGELARDNSATGFRWAVREEERNALWKARHDAYWAALAAGGPGRKVYVTDACVPISRLGECILETKADIDASALAGPMVGHAGDGNFHVQLLVDPESAIEAAEAERIADRIAKRALRLGGTVTGEHGVGLGKMKHMRAEHGQAWDVMAEIKRTLDPQNILNPGKIVEIN